MRGNLKFIGRHGWEGGGLAGQRAIAVLALLATCSRKLDRQPFG